MKTWKTLNRTVLSDYPPWLRLESHEVGLPDGQVIADWVWAETPAFVNVAVVDVDGRFVCFRQPKYAVPDITLSVVGGYVDEGETPEEAAHREVEEEAGYHIGTLRSLGSYAMDGNRGCGVGHLFLAEGCIRSGTQHTDDLEEQEMIWMTPGEVRDALLRGAYGVASWTATLALALLAREE